MTRGQSATGCRNPMRYPNNSVIVRVHEIALKGKNRPTFFTQLARNIRQALRGLPVSRVGKRHMGVEVTLSPEASWEEVSERLSQVFGVVKFYRCHKLPPSFGGNPGFRSAGSAKALLQVISHHRTAGPQVLPIDLAGDQPGPGHCGPGANGRGGQPSRTRRPTSSLRYCQGRPWSTSKRPGARAGCRWASAEG